MKIFFVILVVYAFCSTGSVVKSPRNLKHDTTAFGNHSRFEFTKDPPPVAANEPVFESPKYRNLLLHSLIKLCKVHYKSTEAIFYSLFYDSTSGAEAAIKEAFAMMPMNPARTMIEKEEYVFLCGNLAKTLKSLDFLYFYMEDHAADSTLSLLNLAMELYVPYMNSFQSLRSGISRIMNVFLETNTEQSLAYRKKIAKFYSTHLKNDFEQDVREALKSKQEKKQITAHFLMLTNFDEMDRIFEDYKAMMDEIVPMNADAAIYLLRLEVCMHELVSFQSLLRIFLDNETMMNWKGLRTFLPQRWLIDRNYAILNNLSFPYYAITGLTSSMMNRQMLIMGDNFRNQPQKFKNTAFEEIRNYFLTLDFSLGNYQPIFNKLNEEKLKKAISVSKQASAAKGSSPVNVLQARKENSRVGNVGKQSRGQMTKAAARHGPGKGKQMTKKKQEKITAAKKKSDDAADDENIAPLVENAEEGQADEVEKIQEEEKEPETQKPREEEQESQEPKLEEQEKQQPKVKEQEMKSADAEEEVEDLAQYVEYWRKYLKDDSKQRSDVKENTVTVKRKQTATKTPSNMKKPAEKQEFGLIEITAKAHTPRFQVHFKKDDNLSQESHDILCRLLGAQKGTVEFPEAVQLFGELGVVQICHKTGSVRIFAFPNGAYRLDDTHGKVLSKWLKGHIVHILRLQFTQLQDYHKKCLA